MYELYNYFKKRNVTGKAFFENVVVQLLSEEQLNDVECNAFLKNLGRHFEGKSCHYNKVSKNKNKKFKVYMNTNFIGTSPDSQTEPNAKYKRKISEVNDNEEHAFTRSGKVPRNERVADENAQNSQMEQMKQDLCSLKEKYIKKIKKLNNKINASKKILRRRNQEIEDLKYRNAELGRENKALKKTMRDNEFKNSSIFYTYSENTHSYNTNFRLFSTFCILSCGVAYNKMQLLFETIEFLFNLKFSRIPCVETLRNFVQEASAYSKFYTAFSLMHSEPSSVVLHQDGTLKNQKRLIAVNVSTPTFGTFTLGLDKVFRETADAILNTVVKFFEQLADAYTAVEGGISMRILEIYF